MRNAYHQQIDALTARLTAMTRLVQTAMDQATTALLGADREAAHAVITSDAKIDELRHDTVGEAVAVLGQQQPVAGDLRTIVTALQISSDLERMGDLARHLAELAHARHPDAAVPDAQRPSVSAMGSAALAMVAKAGRVITSKNVTMALELRADDEAMDRLHAGVFDQLHDEGWSHGIDAAVRMALIARTYERFADHTVSIAGRIVYLVTGEDASAHVPYGEARVAVAPVAAVASLAAVPESTI
jgi:phosphate transport system protein